jgi:hypothetical protein
MYRIRFETKGAFWVIELAVFHGMYWKRIHIKEQPLSFETLGEARSFVVQRGISLIYKDHSESYDFHYSRTMKWPSPPPPPGP